ncbi:MAG TPA: type VI secretion protein IcmF/TssM N-terminal domain-containing protein, partial [Gemmataceae bacterium]|nr:type VI secretion protein IcmF/TssM N-terminal domain-containing protein [Gemmataceae bacterium]
PYCPINGVLAVLPFTATDTREDAEQTGAILQQDLTAIRGVMQAQCPVFALVSDLETATGFNIFLERFPSEQRQRRVGQRFPLLPDLAEGQGLLEVVDRSIQWISSALFPSHIYRLFQVEGSGHGDAAAMTVGNVELYQLLTQMRERQKRLSSLITRAIAADQKGPYLFGGCYLAATGAGPKGAQAFLPGVFRRLIENQSFVAWTDDGFQEEEDYRRWTRYGYLGLAGIAVVLLALGSYRWLHSS